MLNFSEQDVSDIAILPILDAPQFARADVLAVTGLTPAALKNTLDRNLVCLPERHNPGTGRRRLFSGADILKIAAAHTLSGVGVPMRMLEEFSNIIVGRARITVAAPAAASAAGGALILFPLGDGTDWQIIVAGAETSDGDVPAAFVVLNMDQLIKETLRKIEAVIADEPVPDFSPKPQNTNSRDPFKYEEDGSLAGLTAEETAEYYKLRAIEMISPESPDAPNLSPQERSTQTARFIFLSDKHHDGCLRRMFAKDVQASSGDTSKQNSASRLQSSKEDSKE